jgi:hypothetical protein
MTTRTIRTKDDLALLLRFLRDRKLPFTVEVHSGAKRTTDQNRLQRLWLNEVAEQMGDRTPEEVRGYCKLTMGVPILRAENENFRDRYDAVVRPLPYDQKLAIMMEPLDLPVTRLMSVEQKTRYLDAIFRHFSEQGLALTLPAVAA